MKLLSGEPVNKVTVKQLVEDCGINRNTFYYHYPDITALLEEIMRDETDKIINQYPTIDTMEQGLEVAIEFALKNRDAVMHIYKSVNRDIYEKYLWFMLDYVAGQYFETLFSGH
ncbi:MAG: TetR/AcrR family transcriptional regulator [Lachnospiraceae bacterium]|nr:TetR/AcrR family transcriptional regulator [Candidatus Darwinimomas equi]